MTHQFLILSYRKDFPWLPVALKSIQRFAEGFLPPIVVVPEPDSVVAWDVVKKCGSPALVIARPEPAGLGQLFSQVCKCEAETFSTADMVWFIDSDCLLFDRLAPDMFFYQGKPVMCFNSFRHLSKCASGAMVWQDVVSQNLGWRVENDYLRRMPLIYPRVLFPALRKHIERFHRRPFREYVYGTGKNSWPQRFCESNDLGAFAHRHMPELFHWSSLDHGGNWYNPVIQFWSHGGFDRPCDASFSFCGGNTRGKTPREVITTVLGEGII